MSCNSCVGCKFLYTQQEGYSDYTVTDEFIECALDKNPNLPADEPIDWRSDMSTGEDNWPATQNSRCGSYSPIEEEREHVVLDVDKEIGPADCTDDEEAVDAICKHAEVGPYGGWLQ